MEFSLVQLFAIVMSVIAIALSCAILYLSRRR